VGLKLHLRRVSNNDEDYDYYKNLWWIIVKIVSNGRLYSKTVFAVLASLRETKIFGNIFRDYLMQ
jgi:hypothetical protein